MSRPTFVSEMWTLKELHYSEAESEMSVPCRNYGVTRNDGKYNVSKCLENTVDGKNLGFLIKSF